MSVATHNAMNFFQEAAYHNIFERRVENLVVVWQTVEAPSVEIQEHLRVGERIGLEADGV